jgi:hypothetical protein
MQGDQGIALEGNKDIEHDVDIEDDDMEDYNEIENVYSCNHKDIYEDENKDVDIEL